MDHGSFDTVARLLGSAGSRRAALGALLASGLAGAIAGTEAAKKDRGKRRRTGRKDRGQAQVSAQAVDCLSVGHSSNMSGCDYSGADFSGFDLYSSRMVGTIFEGATLVKTDLSSSNLKNATFEAADLCGADISSSTLRNTNFIGADLTRADLHSSACGGANFTGAILCATVTCNGTIRNDDCPPNVFGICCDTDDCRAAGTVCDEAANRCCAVNGVNVGNHPASIACCSGFKCANNDCIDHPINCI